MTERRRTLVIICVIGWSLLLQGLLMSLILTYFYPVSIRDFDGPGMSWLSDLLPVASGFGFVTACYSTTGLFIALAVERESGDPVWRVRNRRFPDSNEAKP